MTASLRVGISGAAGRMGIALIKALSTHATLKLTACGIRPGSESLAMSQFDHAGVNFASTLMVDSLEGMLDKSDAVIDFSAPEHAAKLATLVGKQGKIIVCGTTGLSPAQKEAMVRAGDSGRVVLSSNMSIGVNLLMALVEHASAKLGNEFDVEVLEMHHRYKVDAPSGTALSLGIAAARGRDVQLRDVWTKSRDGHTGPRVPGSIGFATLRGGDVIGDHKVMFAGAGERIELSHSASNRDIFARGALAAVEWASHKPAGFYTMRDVVKL